MPTSLDQLAAWLAAPEGPRLEFKEAKNNFHFEKLVEYCVAVANEGGGASGVQRGGLPLYDSQVDRTPNAMSQSPRERCSGNDLYATVRAEVSQSWRITEVAS